MESYLNVVRDFLVANEHEVILMAIEGGVETERLDSIYGYTRPEYMMYDHTWGTQWPTLAEMIETNKRLVVLSDNGDAESFNGIHGLWHYTVDVNYDIQNASEFDCTYDRGNPNGLFYQLNHFITNITPG